MRVSTCKKREDWARNHVKALKAKSKKDNRDDFIILLWYDLKKMRKYIKNRFWILSRWGNG